MRDVYLDESRCASPLPSPEDYLIAKEEPENDERDESISPEVINAVLDELETISPLDADIMELILRGCSRTDLGVVFDMSESAVAQRIVAATRRVRWLVGPYRWFGIQDILDLGSRGLLTELQARHLAMYWETTSYSECARRMQKSFGQARYPVQVALGQLRRHMSDPQVSIVVKGFDELQVWGMNARHPYEWPAERKAAMRAASVKRGCPRHDAQGLPTPCTR